MSWTDDDVVKEPAPAAAWTDDDIAKPTTNSELLKQQMGPSDFTKAFASTPARMFKSGMQMVGAGDYVPEFVSDAAAEGDKSVTGRIVGDIAGTGGIRAAAGPLVNAIKGLNEAKGFLPAVGRVAESAGYGAAQGAITSPDQQAEAAKWGAGGGAGGQILSRVAGGLVKPTASAKELMDRGVALTPGQAGGVGSVANKVEQWVSSNPAASFFITNAQRRAVEEANRVAAESVAGVVQQNVKLGMPPREAIEQTRDLISDAYRQSLGGMSWSAQALKTDVEAAMKHLPTDLPLTPQKTVRDIETYLTNRVGPWIKQNPNLTGEQLKQVDSELGQMARGFANSPNPTDKVQAPAWREVQSYIRSAMEAAAATPEQHALLSKANTAYRQLMALEKAMLPGNETFTPRRLRMTLEKMGIKDTDLNQVANAMDQTLPNTVPNSGTAERLMANALPALLMGGGAGAQSMGWDTLGTGMMAAGALGSRPGARFMTGDLMGQPVIGAALRELRRVAPAMRGDRKGEGDE